MRSELIKSVHTLLEKAKNEPDKREEIKSALVAIGDTTTQRSRISSAIDNYTFGMNSIAKSLKVIKDNS